MICGVGSLCIASRSLEGEGSSGVMGVGGRRGCLFVGGVLGQLARLQSNWLGRYYCLSDSAADGNVDDGDQLRLDDGGGGQTLGGEGVWPDLGLKASCM